MRLEIAKSSAKADEPTDEALITGIAARDAAAMRALYRRHEVRTYRFILRIVDDAALAEDLLSEVFFEVWRQSDKFRSQSRASTWILAIARYKAWDARRCRTRRGADFAEAGAIADSADTPEQSVLILDRNEKLRRCLAQLSTEHREIIDLAYYHDKSIADIAEIVCVPTNTVKTRMFYARKRLRHLLIASADFQDLSGACPA
jgi:RNA polymerase sigma-70 factor (ECF subfamily)